MRIIQPVPGYAHRAPGSPFDAVRHQAVDIPAPAGTPVVAVADGVVRAAGEDTANPYAADFSDSGGGLMVTIDHRAAIPPAVSQYAHLSRVGVTRGQAVRAGQAIGAVGSTGMSTGPHLHFGWRVGAAWRDYREWLVEEGDVWREDARLIPPITLVMKAGAIPYAGPGVEYGEHSPGFTGFAEGEELYCTLIVPGKAYGATRDFDSHGLFWVLPAGVRREVPMAGPVDCAPAVEAATAPYRQLLEQVRELVS